MKITPTLYEWAGDINTFELLFKKFYEKVPLDDLLALACTLPDKK